MNRLFTSRRALRVVAPTVVALGAAAAIAAGAIPNSDGTIQGCYNNPQYEGNGALRVVDNPDQCGSIEVPLNWNQRGPPGPRATPARPVPPDLPGLPGPPGGRLQRRRAAATAARRGSSSSSTASPARRP